MTTHWEISNNVECKKLPDLGSKLANLARKLKIVNRTKKLTAIVKEEAAGFLELSMLIIRNKVNYISICQKIIENSKALVPSFIPYMKHSDSQLQTYIWGCKNVFKTYPTIYWRNSNWVLYGIGDLENSRATTWYQQKETLCKLHIC